MRFALLILFSLCISACIAKRFLQDEEDPILGGYQEIDLKNPPNDYLNTLAYIQNYMNSLCHLNSNVNVEGVEKASVQIVAGKNYEIVFKVSNYSNQQLTVNVFQSLPNNNGQTSYSVDTCN